MRITASKIFKSFCKIFLLGVLAVSCGNDATFYIISQEVAPIPPLIPGAPTNMVVFEREVEYLSDPDDPLSIKNESLHLLFVASGRLHWYGESPDGELRWDRNYKIPQPGGNIIALAVTKDPANDEHQRLYALCLKSNSLNATLRYIGHRGGWENVKLEKSDYPLIQSIYADPDTNQLFAGARRNNKNADIDDYAILYLDNNDTLKILKPATAMLSGAAYRKNEGDYYLCTRGTGIFKVNKTDLETNTINDTTVTKLDYIIETQTVNKETGEIIIQTQNKPNLLFMGMIKLKDAASTIIAVERDGGGLYEVLEAGSELEYGTVLTNSALSQMYYFKLDENENEYIRSSRYATGRYAIGGLALWEDYLNPTGTKLLVATIQSSIYSTSYTNGYVEFDLNSDGSFNTRSPRRDSNRLLTVHDTNRYSTNLGKHPINHLYQTPEIIDTEMTFFASTQTVGLWAYRNRSNGGWQWNAED